MKYNKLKATLNVLNSPLNEVLKHCIITDDTKVKMCAEYTCTSLTCQQVNIFSHNSSLFQQVSEPFKWHGLTESRVNISNCIKTRNFPSHAVPYTQNIIPVTSFSCHGWKCFRGLCFRRLEFSNLCSTGSTRPVSFFMWYSHLGSYVSRCP